ncbi:hypothetical protein TWF281_004543 [Arthrobotrys megalospora]
MTSSDAGDAIRDDLFPHPANSNYGNAILYREKCLRQFSASFRDDPNWTSNLNDRSYFIKRLREAYKQDENVNGEKVAVWDKDYAEFVWMELIDRYRPYALQCKDEDGKGIEPHIEAVWRGDFLVEETVRRALIEAVNTLENVPEDQKLWHPGSNGQVLDLVHPSYWPVIYGRTLFSDGEIINPPSEAYPPVDRYFGCGSDDPDHTTYSKLFCWLPSEFEISEDGKVKIASYVNNLAMENQRKMFYPIIENIFQKFVPLFNHVLADLREGKMDLQRVGWDDRHPTADTYTKLQGRRRRRRERNRKAKTAGEEELEKIKRERVAKELSSLAKKRAEEWEEFLKKFEDDQLPPSLEEPTEGTTIENHTNYISGLAGSKIYSQEALDFGSTQNILVTRPAEQLTGQLWSAPKPEVLEKVKLEGRTVKVIVKLANIVLTPEKPKYEGGRWHVEGMKNERIIATGIYYYQQENITESTLGFRRALEVWGREKGLFDIDLPDTAVQEIGSIYTKENRAVAFPNLYQHKVAPFELVDKTKPGYRKVLVFFLCDPSKNNNCTPTTRTVLPQQPDFRDEVLNILRHGPAGRLPLELFDEIEKYLPSLISKKEAMEYHDKLMGERSEFGNKSQTVKGRYTGLYATSD